MNTPLLDSARLERPDTLVRHDPFPFMIAHGQLPDDARADLDRDFPRYREVGFFPYDLDDCGSSVNALVERLTWSAFASAIASCLAIDGYGTIHADSKSKIATALLYLNHEWPNISEGCLLFLSRIDDIEAMVALEFKPLYGEFAVFRRSENSLHGHLPCEGERRVIQVAWLVDEKARARKTQRGRFSRSFKKVFGGLDNRLVAGRDRNASHRD